GRAAYFLQDFEPWFHNEADSRGRARVKATYALIPHRIVTSEWLRALLADEGYDAQKIALGVDLGFFYPRPGRTAARPVVLAMARGTVCVITSVGGVHRGARHEETCLLVPRKDVNATSRAVLSLLSEDALHRRLRDGALATSRGHSMRQVATQTREAFEKI